MSKKNRKHYPDSSFRVIATIVLVTGACLPKAFAEEEIQKNFSIKVMAFNIWNLGDRSKIWDSKKKQKNILTYSKEMKNLLLEVSPDILVLPELDNNARYTFAKENLVDAFSRNTIDVLNSRPRKQSSFIDVQKNQDYSSGGKGSGSIFSSIKFDDSGKDSIKIHPGNGFPEAVVTGIHLDHGDNSNSRITQAKKLNTDAAAARIPMLILGDFNAGDISERGLHDVTQQLLVMSKSDPDKNDTTKQKYIMYEKLSYNYLNNAADAAKYHKIIQDKFPNDNIFKLSWANWAKTLKESLDNDEKKDIGLRDETYPVSGNLPVTMNTLKKQFQLLQLEQNRELFQPSVVGDGRATWTSDGEDKENKWPGWDRATIDHVMMSRPFAKWVEIAPDESSGNLSKLARLADGVGSLSDHEPVAQNLRWVGPQLETYKDGAGAQEKTRLVWGANAYNFAQRNKEFHLVRNNHRNDVYLGQVADDQGNPTENYLTVAEKKTLLNCAGNDSRLQQAVKNYCLDDHSFIGETLVTDEGLLIVEEDNALGGPQAKLRLANGGLRVEGRSMFQLGREVVLEQRGWIDVVESGHTVSAQGALTGAGSLAKLGAGTLLLSAPNSYTGGTFVEEGTLRAGVAGAFVNNTAYSLNGGTLDLNGFDLAVSKLEGKGGTIQLGNGSLTVDQGVNTHYDGAIEGLGGLTKSGSGELTLNGQNSYTGATLVQEGILKAGVAGAFVNNTAYAINGGTLDLNGFDLTVSKLEGKGGTIQLGNGSLTVDQGVNTHYDGAIEGLGGLTKSGSGELTLNGQNSYTGATLVQEGILKAGVAGAFVNNTAYAINGGTLDLNGFDLTVSKLEGKNGTIQLGNGSLTVDQGVNTHYDGAIEGLGGLTKSGSGGLILNGQNSYTGATLVREGHLVVGDRDHPNARLAGEVTVGQDAMLSGSGTLDRLIIDSGGTVAPGNSIGTLRTGDVTFNAGSVYSAEVGPNGRSDLIDSSGIATLNGGEIRVSLENRTNLLTEEEAKTLVGQTFNILTAQKGIVGQFSSVTPDYLFLNSQISVPPTLQLLSPVVPATPEQPVQPVPAVAIAPTPEPSPSITTTPAQPVQPVPEVAAMSIAVQRNQTSFASVAQTRNERAVATAADTLAPGNPVYESLLTFISAEQARQAFKQLDGQVHSDAAAAQITDSRYVREAVNARLQQTQALNPDAPIQADNSNGGWVQLLGGHTQLNSDHNATGYSSSTSGVLLGLDTDIGDGWRLGGATGYTKTEVKGSSKNSVDSDNFHLSAYGGKRFDTLALRFGAATTWHHFDTSRNLEYGNQSAHQKATYHARTDQVFGEVGYTAWSAFEPFANLTYINFQNDSFKERGKAAALHASKQSQDSIVSTVGLRGQMQLPVSSTRSVKLRGELGWEHQYGELDRESSLKFVGSEAAFAVNSVPASRDGAMVKASAEMAMTKDTQVSLNYTGLLSRQGGGNAVNLGFSFQF